MTTPISGLRELAEVIVLEPPTRIVTVPLAAPHAVVLDLSSKNPRVAVVDYNDPGALNSLIDELLTARHAVVGIGGYGENRGWYARGAQFATDETVRSIHLGIDVWTSAGTPIFAPYDGVIHSLRDNALVGDYGPTLILTHTLHGKTFHTLYGHLSRESLEGKRPGERIPKGTVIGAIGVTKVNGQWPPHLHLQVILDMLGYEGDFPGVASVSDRERFLALCPDPNLILQSSLLCGIS